MKTLFLSLLLLSSGLVLAQPDARTAPPPQRTYAPAVRVIPGRWTPQQANAWYARQPWWVGANFAPSTAINQLEMWQAETWDPAGIDRELGYAQAIGMNIMRVFLHNLVWEADSVGYLRRIDEFLGIADRRGIKIMFVFFDSCWNDNPKPGTQPAPVPGKHNSGWVRAPGSQRLFDSRTWGPLEGYVTGIIRAYRTDPRVVVWDLFNEPSNSGYLDAVMPLLERSFVWARAAKPTQPITSGWWHDHPVSNAFLFANSDIITFHNYQPAADLEKQILDLQRMNRPLICTEYMARKHQSLFETCLPVFKKYKVGALNWGLVQGKTNTIYAWDEPIPSGAEPRLWFHDVFRPDGTPYKTSEVTIIKELTGAAK
jgi:hypothetical protein